MISAPLSEYTELVPTHHEHNETTEGVSISDGDREWTPHRHDRIASRQEAKAEFKVSSAVPEQRLVEQPERLQKHAKVVTESRKTATDCVTVQSDIRSVSALTSLLVVPSSEIPVSQLDDIQEAIHTGQKPREWTRN